VYEGVSDADWVANTGERDGFTLVVHGSDEPCDPEGDAGSDEDAGADGSDAGGR
jgi:hypothetical protein